MVPFTGREGDQQYTGLAECVVKKLVELILNSGVNITNDNWFMSAKLAADLLCKDITLLETMRKNKPEVPPRFHACKRRPVGSSLFGFSQKQAMVSYVPKKNKADNSVCMTKKIIEKKK